MARTAGLIAIAAVPALSGLTGRVYDDPVAFDAGFATALWISAGVLVAGGALAALLVRNDVLDEVSTGSTTGRLDHRAAAHRGRRHGGAAPRTSSTSAAASPGRPRSPGSATTATPTATRWRCTASPSPAPRTRVATPPAATSASCSRTACSRLPQPASDGCEECLAIGARWVDLRVCQGCGRVGCCDSSPHRHATAHARHSGHPLVRSFEPGEDWFYCYADHVALDVPDAPPAPSHP